MDLTLPSSVGITVGAKTRSDTLVVFFAGLGGNSPHTKFQFIESSEDQIDDVNRVFVRDTAKAWYQLGAPPCAQSVGDLCQELKHIIADSGATKVVFVGSSMGGFAAILYSSLLGIGSAIAFSPQTFIGPLNRLAHGDFRWSRQIGKTWARSFRRDRCWDLVPVLRRKQPPVGITVYYAAQHRLDRAHAMRLAEVPNVNLVAIEGQDHNIVRAVRDTNRLRGVLKQHASGVLR
ncbi:MAG: YqiA/YcfP family alpha/beta fold hydrolase [Pseudomonadota bacterium]